jgi:hypothetical protein
MRKRKRCLSDSFEISSDNIFQRSESDERRRVCVYKEDDKPKRGRRKRKMPRPNLNHNPLRKENFLNNIRDFLNGKEVKHNPYTQNHVIQVQDDRVMNAFINPEK